MEIIITLALGLHFLMVVTSYCQQLLAEQDNECDHDQTMQERNTTVVPDPPL